MEKKIVTLILLFWTNSKGEIKSMRALLDTLLDTLLFCMFLFKTKNPCNSLSYKGLSCGPTGTRTPDILIMSQAL